MIKSIKNSKKIIISHQADIDGMGSVIIAKKVFGDIDYILCEVKDLEEVFSEDLSMYESIYVCDLKISEELENIIIYNKLDDRIKCFDHHATTVRDNNAPFVTATVTLGDRKTCGTELFYNEMLNNNHSVIDNDFFKELVEGIRANDTWDETKESFELGRKLTSIYSLLGPVDFINTILTFDESDGFKLPDIYEMVAEADNEKTKRYIENANNNLYKTTYNDYKIGVSISEQYRSILGDEICLMNPDIDFVLIINFERMSCSLRCTRDDINLGLIAQEFVTGSGGHRKAAGFPLNEESLKKIQPIINELLDNKKMGN